jgi:hypothetical protein
VPVNSDYACTVVSQKPANWTIFHSRDSFDAVWKVRNTGNNIWQTSGFDFVYLSGTKFQTHADEFDLPANVSQGKTIDLKVDMEAPKAKGYYTTTWGITIGSQAFCTLTLSINVE